MPPLRPTLAERARRSIAAACAGVVLTLAIFAASPELHHGLHDGDHGEAHHATCAVALFAGGVAPATTDVSPGTEPRLSDAGHRFPREELFCAASHHRLPPGRGPPAQA